LDEKALAANMAYVALNPVRGGMTETSEESVHSSIKERLNHFKQNPNPATESDAPTSPLPFAGYPHQDMLKGLPFRLKDYLEPVDWTGCAILDNKHGYIQGYQPPILDRLQIEPKHWLYMTQHFESRFKELVGASYLLKAAC
jgi:hypothetical protein